MLIIKKNTETDKQNHKDNYGVSQWMDLKHMFAPSFRQQKREWRRQVPIPHSDGLGVTLTYVFPDYFSQKQCEYYMNGKI